MPEASPATAKPTDIKALARELEGAAWAVGRLQDADRIFEAVARAEHAGDFSDMRARDPRDVGVRGGYPQVNQGGPQAGLLEFARRAYRRSAPAKVVVDRVAADQWGEWFDLQGGSDEFRAAVEAFMRNPTGKVGCRPLWWWFKRAQRLARRDGRCLLYFGLKESGAVDPRQPPGNVQGVRYLHIIREHQIADVEIDEDPDSDEFNEIKGWTVRLAGNKGQGKTITVHPSRVLAFIPKPNEDDLTKGDSELVDSLNYVEGIENVLWSAIEAYFTEASPYIVAYRALSPDGTPAVPMTPEQKAEVKAEIAKMQQSSVQRIFLHGVKLEVLSGSGQLANPTPHWDIANEAFGMAMGMPRSILRGDAAGEIAAAREDSRRWQSIISKVQEEEGDPLVTVLISRLEEWDVESWIEVDDADRVQIKWRPIYEEDAKDEAGRQLVLAQTRAIYVDRGMDPPVEVEWEPTENPDVLAAVTNARPPPSAFGGGFGGGNEDEAKARGEEAKDAVGPLGVNTLVKRMRGRVASAIKKAYEVGLAAARLEDAASDASLAIRASALEDDLQEAIRLGLEDAARAGAKRSFQDLGVKATRDLLRAERADNFRTVSAGLAADVAARVSDDVRRTIAQGLVEGLDAKLIRDRLHDQFALREWEAERIARTETLRGWNAGTRDALRTLGIDAFRFVALPGADEQCAERDGNVYSLGDLENSPPIHPNCRCTLVAVDEGATGITLRGATLPEGVALVSGRA